MAEISGVINQNIKGNVGNITGCVNGNIYGNVLGNINGCVNGNIYGNVHGKINGIVNGVIKGRVFGSVNSILGPAQTLSQCPGAISNSFTYLFVPQQFSQNFYLNQQLFMDTNNNPGINYLNSLSNWFSSIKAPDLRENTRSMLKTMPNMKEDINQVPNYSSSIDCPICLENINEMISTICGHVFCKECCDQIFVGKALIKCPICCKIISKNETHNIFL